MGINTNPLIMGILNTTPDSFSDGGKFIDVEIAVQHALQLINEGADIIDIGGESTRPGAKEVDLETEFARTIPVIEELRKHSDVKISIDTRKPQIAQAAIKAGANIWNDVSALSFSPDSVAIAASLNVPVVLMHFKGLPENMQDNPNYNDVTNEMLGFFAKAIGNAIANGIKRENIIIDVGIGFGKSLEHNIEIISQLERFGALGLPLLVGASRKSLIGKIDESANDPSQRLGGSIALAMIAADKGADIIRVHDVRETKQAFLIRKRILEK
jgi:dihydropteroate synthase